MNIRFVQDWAQWKVNTFLRFGKLHPLEDPIKRYWISQRRLLQFRCLSSEKCHFYIHYWKASPILCHLLKKYIYACMLLNNQENPLYAHCSRKSLTHLHSNTRTCMSWCIRVSPKSVLLNISRKPMMIKE